MYAHNSTAGNSVFPQRDFTFRRVLFRRLDYLFVFVFVSSIHRANWLTDGPVEPATAEQPKHPKVRQELIEYCAYRFHRGAR